jgi:hypothetical protein
MGAIVDLTPSDIFAEPGGQESVAVKIHNTGSVVDLFTVTVLGDAAEWAQVEPRTVSLFPGAQESVVVTFRPPRSSSAMSGEIPFGIKVDSKEDPGGSSVEEGLLHVGTFTETFIELIPRTARGRTTVTYDVALDNRGNTPINATLVATDPNELLQFDAIPPGVLAAPNTAVFAKLKVKPRERFWTGPPKSHPFQVAVQGPGLIPLTADGTLLQEALIPKWLPRALLGLLTLLIAAIVGWFALMKPAIRSEAAEITEEKLEPVKAAAVAQEKNQQATAQAVEKLTGGAVPAPSFTPVAGPVAFDLRLPAKPFAIAPGKEASDGFEIPEGRTLKLTDVILGNPGGDSGSLFVQRDNGILMEVRLDNFRDLDYHFASPIILEAGQRLVLRGKCDNRASPPDVPAAKNCTPAAYFIGELE